MPPEGSAPRWSTVVSRREARLLFWLVVLALVGIVFVLYSESLAVLATPAIILFVAWLMSYVLEPPVTLVQRHLPFRGRGVAVAITYLVTAVVAFVVIAGAGVAVINAAVAFIDNMPTILSRLGEILTPVVSALGLSTPGDGSVVAKIQEFVAENAGEIADGITALARNAIVVVASLVTAVIISVGLAMGQVSLLGWLRRFLPSSTYRDLTELEGAIAVSFGGFVRGRLVIGAIYGVIIALSAVVLGIPYAPLIAVIAGLIVFIPWIGPLIGWAVLPAFALILAPAEVAPAAAISIVAAIAIQVGVTQFVMAGAVKMAPVGVFVVVILGTAVAGVIGAIFAIPTAAAILAITDYLRERDVLLRSEPAAEDGAPASLPDGIEAEATAAPAVAGAGAVGALALEPGRRVVRDLGLVEVRPLLARGPGGDGHALAVAGGLGRPGPVRLGEQRVEGRDVGLDGGRDDVRPAGRARVLARAPLAADVGRRDPDADGPDRVGPLPERVDVVGEQARVAGEHARQRLVDRPVQRVDRAVALGRRPPFVVAGRR